MLFAQGEWSRAKGARARLWQERLDSDLKHWGILGAIVLVVCTLFFAFSFL